MLTLSSSILVFFISTWVNLVHYSTSDQELRLHSYLITTKESTCRMNGTQCFYAYKDSIIFLAYLDTQGLNSTNWSVGDVLFLIKTGFTFQPLCMVYFGECSNDLSALCYCKIKTDNVYTIVINQTASTNSSKAFIKGQWYSQKAGKKIYSEVQQYPLIIDPPRCKFPMDLRGLWKTSTKAVVKFTDSQIRGFNPCQFSRDCTNKTQSIWDCILDSNNSFFLRTSPAPRPNKEKHIFTCLHLQQKSPNKFNYYLDLQEGKYEMSTKDYLVPSMDDVCNAKREKSLDMLDAVVLNKKDCKGNPKGTFEITKDCFMFVVVTDADILKVLTCVSMPCCRNFVHNLALISGDSVKWLNKSYCYFRLPPGEPIAFKLCLTGPKSYGSVKVYLKNKNVLEKTKFRQCISFPHKTNNVSKLGKSRYIFTIVDGCKRKTSVICNVNVFGNETPVGLKMKGIKKDETSTPAKEGRYNHASNLLWVVFGLAGLSIVVVVDAFKMSRHGTGDMLWLHGN